MAQLFGVNNVGLLDPTDFFANSRAQSFFLDNTPQTALSAADKIVQNANQRARRIRGEHNPKNIGITLNTNFPGMSQTTIPEDTPNLGNLNINPKQTAPAILAHEIGHVSQNHVRQANNIRRMYIRGTTVRLLLSCLNYIRLQIQTVMVNVIGVLTVQTCQLRLVEVFIIA